MSTDFLSLRVRLATSTAIAAEAFESSGAVVGNCFQNVKHLIELHGGSFAYGWAFSGLGPVALSGEVQPLYSGWCNHVIWRDGIGRLWEVTPSGDPLDVAKIAIGPTNFILDEYAQFEIATDDVYCPQPAIYIPTRPEGEWTSDCLCLLERAIGVAQDYWLARTIYSIKQAGLVPTNWHVRRIGAKLRDVWIMAALPAPLIAHDPIAVGFTARIGGRAN
jgi:hypothetical protein